MAARTPVGSSPNSGSGGRAKETHGPAGANEFWVLVDQLDCMQLEVGVEVLALLAWRLGLGRYQSQLTTDGVEVRGNLQHTSSSPAAFPVSVFHKRRLKRLLAVAVRYLKTPFILVYGSESVLIIAPSKVVSNGCSDPGLAPANSSWTGHLYARGPGPFNDVRLSVRIGPAASPTTPASVCGLLLVARGRVCFNGRQCYSSRRQAPGVDLEKRNIQKGS
ncbi:hypothetical protein V8F20_003062 [Naviculisporaceae sp. PSN 640]